MMIVATNGKILPMIKTKASKQKRNNKMRLIIITNENHMKKSYHHE